MAKLIYQIVSGDGRHKPQFDEQLRLVGAVSAADAFDRAHCMGKQNEISFVNEKQQPVKWEFVDIAELYKLPALQDGAEINSRFSETDNAGLFIDITHRKAAQIRSSMEELSIETI